MSSLSSGLHPFSAAIPILVHCGADPQNYPLDRDVIMFLLQLMSWVTYWVLGTSIQDLIEMSMWISYGKILVQVFVVMNMVNYKIIEIVRALLLLNRCV